MGAQSNAADSHLATSLARRPGALYWLALGTFAIGTEGFMIAALLVPIATDLRVSIARAGLLVSIFALAYATSSPVLTVLTGRVDRRRLLISSMSLFAMLNMAAAMAHSFLALAAARGAISTDILDFHTRVLAIQGGKGRLMDSPFDPGHGSTRDPGHGSTRLIVRSRSGALGSRL